MSLQELSKQRTPTILTCLTVDLQTTDTQTTEEMTASTLTPRLISEICGESILSAKVVPSRYARDSRDSLASMSMKLSTHWISMAAEESIPTKSRD
jgi:hypothetical protein